MARDPEKPSVAWVDGLVQVRRDRGGYSEEELAAYRREMLHLFGLEDEPAAAGE